MREGVYKFEFIMSVAMKSTVVLNVLTYSVTEIYRHFGPEYLTSIWKRT
jgi:hypothetical protein